MSNSKFFAAAIAVAIMLPSLASAATVQTTVTTGANFCAQLPQISAQITARVNEAMARIDAKRQEISQTLQNRQNNRSQQLQDARAKAKTERDEAYAQLESKATTDAEKQAVSAFESTMNTAVATREAAVDAARNAFWSGLQTVLQGRANAVKTAETNYQTSVNAAISTATSQCSSGTAPATARQNFINALQAARTKFASDRKAVDNAVPQVKALALTRDQAVQQAVSAFRATAEQARTTLKAAFGR